MKSPLDIQKTIERYSLEDEMLSRLEAFDKFIWQDFQLETIEQLLAYEQEYIDYSKEFDYHYDNLIGGFSFVDMEDGNLDFLIKGCYQCVFENLKKEDDVFIKAGLSDLESLVINSFLADISGLYRLDLYREVPPFVKSVCDVLNTALAKIPSYSEIVVRACSDCDKCNFMIGDIFEPGFCLTTSADLDWINASNNRYNITPLSLNTTKAKAIFKIYDNSEKQVTFLQDSRFEIIDIKDFGDNKKEIFMKEIE